MMTRTPFGSINDDWETFPLTQFVFFQEGPGLRKWQWTNSGMKVINVKNILADGTIDITNTSRHISLEEFELKYSHFAVQEKDIVVASSGNTYGKVGRITEKHLPLMMNTSVIRFHPFSSDSLDDNFLYAFLRSHLFRNQIETFVIGSAQPNFGPVHLKQMKLPLPPLPTQRKIASILSAYDDLIENNLRRIKTLEEMAQALYREWFVKFRFPGHEKVRMVDSVLGKIPEGWEVVPFTDIADVLSGGTPKTKVTEYWGGSIPFFAPKDAPSSFYVTNTDKYITEMGLGKCNSRLYPKETVFITARGTVGKVVMPSVDMAMNQSCYALQGKSGINQHFLFLATQSQVDYLKKNTGGATFDTIVVDTFRRMQFVRPNISLIDEFSLIVQPLMGLVLNSIEKNQNLSQTRDLLLPKLISGELDISDLDIDTSALEEPSTIEADGTLNSETQTKPTPPTEAKEAPKKHHPTSRERTPSTPSEDQSPTPIDEWETNDVLSVFRSVARGRGFMDREDFIQEAAREMGYERLGPRIGSALKGHIRVALRRRVLESNGDGLRIATQSISGYDTDELIDTLRFITRKGHWLTREDAIREAAQHLGFQRVTGRVQTALKNAIRTAIRRGLFEGDREELRRLD